MLVESSSQARDRILGLIQRVLPLDSEVAENLLFSVVDDRGLLGIIGLVGLVWASSRLFGSLRTVLEIVFDIPPEDRLGIVEGKIHDLKLVVVVGTLFVLTISLTTALRWIENYGISMFGIDVFDISGVTSTASTLIAFAITLMMFYFVYRHAPGGWIPRQDAAIAALVTGLLFELAKVVFIAYLSNFGRFLQLYGSFTNVVIVSFWVYYSSIVFIVGGEVARISQVHRGRGERPGWTVRGVEA